MNDESLTVRTPGKLILSGEHAVVYGYPALAMAIDRYMEATIRWSTPLHFSFHFMGIDFRRRVTLRTLKKLKAKLSNQYDQYRLGHLRIREVLTKPFELSLFAFINVLDRLKNKLPTGMAIVTDSTIPMGCGMGSSAASVVSITYALSKFLNSELSIDDYIALGIESENLQHGYSSGLDVHTVYRGGCLHYEKGIVSERRVAEFPMQLVQTGQPQSTTGECIMQARPFFQEGHIGTDFAAVTTAFDAALQASSIARLQDSVRHNHRLLRTIGVVPDRVNAFIEQLENRGAAAKVCGAGSVRGDQAGVVLVVATEDITAIAAAHGYTVMPIHMTQQGTHVIH